MSIKRGMFRDILEYFMENVITSLPSRVNDAAMNQGFQPLSNGVVSHASDLFAAYTDDSADNSKLACIKAMTFMSPDEFSKECKAAQALADTVDAANGFKAIEGTKKMEERYGLKRRVLNQRLSEAKRLFGVFKQAPDVLKEKGYFAAVAAARQWLSDNKKTWDGNTALSSDEKQAKASKAALVNALAEGLADGMDVDTAKAAAENKVFETKVQALLASLVKTHDGDTLFTVALRLIEATDVDAIDQAITYLSEAKMIAMEGNAKAAQE
jgi:hypothetical protein